MKHIDHTSSCNVTKNNEQRKKQIKLHCSNKLVSVPVEKIVRLEADSNYTVVHTQTKKYVSARTLKHYEDTLDDTYFIRVHKSHLINIRYAKSLEIQANNSALAFDGGKNIEISRRKVKAVIEKFSFYNK